MSKSTFEKVRRSDVMPFGTKSLQNYTNHERKDSFSSILADVVTEARGFRFGVSKCAKVPSRSTTKASQADALYRLLYFISTILLQKRLHKL